VDLASNQSAVLELLAHYPAARLISLTEEFTEGLRVRCKTGARWAVYL